MTTNKPEAVAWSWDYRGRHVVTTDYSKALELSEPPYPTEVEPLIRLADYQRLQADLERLQAECEKLRKDAGRYRFARAYENDCFMLNTLQVASMEDLDTAIDAAMEGDKP